MINKNIKLETGNILSECSHYIIDRIYDNDIIFAKHFESNTIVKIGKEYIHDYTQTADYYDSEIEVTKEDKKDGTLGIRSIFEGIHSSQVFTVCFKKADKSKSKKALNAEIETKVGEFITAVDKAKAQKKGVAEIAKKYFGEIIQNPILAFEEGEDRILRGYKIQFESRDGKYNCVDMDIEKTDKEAGIRPVNILTIKWLIYNGTKYIVK